MTTKPNVLFVLTSCNKLGDGHPTEFAHPYNVLEDVANITIVSPKGGEAPLDEASVEMFKEEEESMSFLKNRSSLWKNTKKLSEFANAAKDFDAIFYVGGHGPMIDLVDDAASLKLAGEFFDNGKIVSAVCHGPVALAKVKIADGSYLIAGQPVTGFSNAEEDEAKLTKSMPFLLEDLLKTNGGKYEKASEPWGPQISIGRSGRLLTGQNPASAKPLAEALKKALAI